VVVADVLGHESIEMPLVKHDDLIEQVATAIPDETLGDAIRRCVSEAGLFGFYTKSFDGADNFIAEIGRSVEDKLFRRQVVRESFT
jgi:hypothetical protein